MWWTRFLAVLLVRARNRRVGNTRRTVLVKRALRGSIKETRKVGLEETVRQGGSTSLSEADSRKVIGSSTLYAFTLEPEKKENDLEEFSKPGGSTSLEEAGPGVAKLSGTLAWRFSTTYNYRFSS